MNYSGGSAPLYNTRFSSVENLILLPQPHDNEVIVLVSKSQPHLFLNFMTLRAKADCITISASQNKKIKKKN